MNRPIVYIPGRYWLSAPLFWGKLLLLRDFLFNGISEQGALADLASAFVLAGLIETLGFSRHFGRHAGSPLCSFWPALPLRYIARTTTTF